MLLIVLTTVPMRWILSQGQYCRWALGCPFSRRVRWHLKYLAQLMSVVSGDEQPVNWKSQMVLCQIE